MEWQDVVDAARRLVGLECRGLLLDPGRNTYKDQLPPLCQDINEKNK